MDNATILIVIGKDAALADLAQSLENIRDLQARASIFIVGELPAFPVYAIGVPPYGMAEVPAEWHVDVTALHTALQQKTDAIEALLNQHDVSGEVAFAAEHTTGLVQAITQKAMFCDMISIDNDLRASGALFDQIVNGLLVGSPVGVFLNNTHVHALKKSQKVFVAWNTQLHSARAVHQALPILKRAKEVIVGVIDPQISEVGVGEDPGVDVAKWLSEHGCNVVVHQYPTGKLNIGECILARSNEAGSDLIVMGAYGHSRTRQALFGGTTRTLVSQSKQAVFLAH